MPCSFIKINVESSSSLLPFLRGIVFSGTFVLFQPFIIDLVKNSHFTFSIGED